MRAPLLYLPGLDGTGRLLYRQERLHDRFAVHCASYPQDCCPRYDELADLGAAILDTHGDGRPAVVLAESFGGGVALSLALRRPDLVQRLVLVNTFAYYPRRFWLSLSILVSGFFPNRPGHPATRLFRGPFFFTRDVPEEHRRIWWERTTDVPMSSYAGRIRQIAELDLRPRLHEIRVPALVLVARNDLVVPASAGRYLARHLPNARKIEIRTAHAGLVEPSIDIATLLSETWHRIRP